MSRPDRPVGARKGGVAVIEVFTDGACLGNPGPGGWAYVVDGGAWASGAAADTTNQRMELVAAFTAVEALEGPLKVVSDSTYVVNCFRQGWWKGWHKRGWKNSQRQPVANRDLWEPFIELVNARGDVTFEWVKGHAGHRMNDAADRLATAAAASQQGAGGDRFVDGVLDGLAPDRPARPGSSTKVIEEAASSPQAPGADGSEHLVAVVGHRPPELGGYRENPVSLSVRRRLIEILRAKRELTPGLVVATGLGLGAEMLAAEAAAAAGVGYVAVLAFEGLDERWPEATRRRFRELRAGALREVVVNQTPPQTPSQFGAAMARRDDWLARHSGEVIMVRRSDDRTLGEAQRKFERELGEDVWILEPGS